MCDPTWDVTDGYPTPEQMASRIRELEQQLADSDLAFNHANEVIGKLEQENAKLRTELVAAWSTRDWLASLVPPDQIKTSDEYHVTLLPLGEPPEDKPASNAQASPKIQGAEAAND